MNLLIRYANSYGVLYKGRYECVCLYLHFPDFYWVTVAYFVTLEFVVLFPSAEEIADSDHVRKDGLHKLWPIDRDFDNMLLRFSFII